MNNCQITERDDTRLASIIPFFIGFLHETKSQQSALTSWQFWAASIILIDKTGGSGS